MDEQNTNESKTANAPGSDAAAKDTAASAAPAQAADGDNTTTVALDKSSPGKTTTTQEDGKGGGSERQQGSFTDMLPLLLVFGALIVFMFVLPSRARKKQQQKFEDMYKNLRRDDRVMLQGGKFVTIDKVENDRVFVFADANRNVREEYHRNAVIMLAKDASADSAKKE